jgi:hypothetical protein
MNEINEIECNLELNQNNAPDKVNQNSLLPDEEEYLEYRKNDPVAKWQYTEDDNVLMVNMCPENLIKSDFLNSKEINTIGENDSLPTQNEAVQNVNPTAGTSSASETDAINDPTVTIAPGEGLRPTSILRTKNWDTKLTPHLHPDGKNGVDQDRVTKLSTLQYLEQRLMNKDPRFAECTDWIYAFLSKIEREQLERNHNIAFNKGQCRSDNQGRKCYTLEDPYAVFEKISNTPKYWQAYKSEIIAKLKNCGPFQLFFTLSCAEKRYAENITTLLRQQFGNDLKITIRYVDENEIEDDNVDNEVMDALNEEMELDDDDLENLINELNEDMLFEESNIESNQNPNKTQNDNVSQQKRDQAHFDLQFDLDSDNEFNTEEEILSSNIHQEKTPPHLNGAVFEDVAMRRVRGVSADRIVEGGVAIRAGVRRVGATRRARVCEVCVGKVKERVVARGTHDEETRRERSV